MLDRAPDVTRLVDRLQAGGLVKRKRGNNDQRQAVTCITPKGLKLLEAMQPEIEANLDGLVGRLSETDCRELARLCSVLFEDRVQAETEVREVEQI
jgi:DNA-binding MarR family transcriptional regulator